MSFHTKHRRVLHAMRSISTFCLFALAVTSAANASEVRVWGDVAYVATYDPAKSIFSVPAILATKNVINLVAGPTYVLALTSDKQVVAWGSVTAPLQAAALAVPVSIQGHTSKIAAFGATVLALTDAGQIVGWGQNFRSLLSGIPSTTSDIVDISICDGCAFAWKADGDVVSWGDNQMSAPVGTKVNAAIGIEGLSIFIDKSDGRIRTWGDESSFPDQIPSANIYADSLIAGKNTGLFSAVKTDGTIAMWGQDSFHLKTIPLGVTTISQLALGVRHAVICRADGTIVTWGDQVDSANGLEIPIGWEHAISVAAGSAFSVGIFSQPPNGTAPTGVNWLSVASVHVGDPSGKFINSLIATDGDPGDRHVFTLVSGAGDENNALVTIVDNRVLIAGAIPGGASNLTIRIRAEDSGGLIYDTPLTIAVLPDSESRNDDSNEAGGCGLGGGVSIFLLFVFFARKMIR